MASLQEISSTTASRQQQTGWLTVGLKLILGVALASNGCIGTLLILNHHATQKVSTMITEVLAIREQVDVDLRNSIVELQHEFMDLPDLFTSNPRQTILKRVEQEFPVDRRQRLEGRDSYGPAYSRGEKRDLAKGEVVVSLSEGAVLLSHGVFDAQGQFSEAVEQLWLTSENPEQVRLQLEQLVREEKETAVGKAFYESRIGQLRLLAADKSLEAEQSRTRILGHIDRINHQQQRMYQALDRQQRQSVLSGMAAITINLLVLFFLTRRIVERPLKRLTRIVEALGAGEFPEIPWRNRRDQIGVLCAAIARFREALLRLRGEERRKEEDRQQIRSLVATMTATIHGLDNRSVAMSRVAHTLEELAEQTERASTDVAGLAEDTARRTMEVNDSSRRISTAVGEIQQELEVQNQAVGQIVGEIEQARRQLDALRSSVTEIDSIVGTVHAITDQTKILAINATIEAVKAGQYGRGFAVVADEVKNLSQDTATATRDVLEKIEAINATCQAFIESFDSIAHGADALHRVTTTIDQAINQQHRLSNGIVELTEATGTNTREVSTRIAQVNAAAAGVLQHAMDTNRCAEEIALELSGLLSGSVRSLDALTGEEALSDRQENTHSLSPVKTPGTAEGSMDLQIAMESDIAGAQAG
jgi:methyl-accepting chemotaxis protein